MYRPNIFMQIIQYITWDLLSMSKKNIYIFLEDIKILTFET